MGEILGMRSVKDIPAVGPRTRMARKPRMEHCFVIAEFAQQPTKTPVPPYCMVSAGRAAHVAMAATRQDGRVVTLGLRGARWMRRDSAGHTCRAFLAAQS